MPHNIQLLRTPEDVEAAIRYSVLGQGEPMAVYQRVRSQRRPRPYGRGSDCCGSERLEMIS
jgi:hypothetical protein